MNKERFLSLVKNPALLKSEDAPFLEELLKEFPFFQSAHLLAARCYKVSDSIHLQKQIKTAAAHIIDRRVLYHLIENFENVEPTKGETLIQEKPIQESLEPSVEENTPIENREVEVSKEEIIKEIKIDELVIIEDNPIALNQSAKLLEGEVSKTIITEEDILPSKSIDFNVENISSNIEAEIPLEREIKLALAESIYTQEFEQIVAENPENSIKKEVFLPNVDEKSIKEQEIVQNEVENENTEEIEAPSEFVTWLKKLQANQLSDVKEEPKSPTSAILNESEKLVEAFMDKPLKRPKPVKQEFYSPVNMAKQSVSDNDFFVTETLAKIYIKQGNLAKAIKVYQNLSLKSPEKNNIFAAQIKILKEQLHNKSGK